MSVFMKNLKTLIGITLILLTSLSFIACSENESDGRTITGTKDYVLTIASHRVLGVAPLSGNLLSEVYVAKKDDSNDWAQQPEIGGFEYEDGYEFRIKVRETSYLDYSMGDPAWTEFKMMELISKEKKTSENVPTNLIPEWYEPQNDVRIQYAIEADDKELIETDLEFDVTLPWNCKMDMTYNCYAIWDSNNKLVDCGRCQRRLKNPESFPETYKILPIDDGMQIRGYGESSFESDMKIDFSKSYDTFFVEAKDNLAHKSYGWLCCYQDVSEYYKKKYPEAGVKTVVIRQAFCMEKIVHY